MKRMLICLLLALLIVPGALAAPALEARLTEDGLAIANRMYERHKLLSDWLTYLGVPKDIATEDACRIEHVISQESFEKIRAHVREMNEHL